MTCRIMAKITGMADTGSLRHSSLKYGTCSSVKIRWLAA